MEHTTSPVLSGIMVRLRNRKGFSLIELAIVLVIIGIIIAAILKGQDLLFNSRTKQFITSTNAWKVAAYAYMDRNNRFPGDAGRNGNIADESTTEQTTTGTAIAEVATALSNVPPNPVVIGGQSYWTYLGSMVSTNGGLRNIMVICPSVECTTALSPDDVEMIRALDISLDGTADGGIGALRALILSGGAVGTDAAAAGARANGWVQGTDSTLLADTTVDGATVAWTTGVVQTQYGAVWAFDKKF
ncbi:MAG: prepilin-type N-terminal cleavage/methylation domain-containing protein [Desulfuromonadaceae bacterium]|nr:prepilin-type N-terminal cleavage/methylation domain-containing protein [Desulfuromonadaceae bacterium]MDD5104089.1 prepilin-type N-terminal cleavage/methylation domain-containing protein [Desulfuromonadaceae bacterium]